MTFNHHRYLYGKTKSNKQFLLSVICALCVLVALSGCGGGSSSNSTPADSGRYDGKAGSLSRFALVGDFLYAIAGRKLQLFHIANDPSTLSVYANVDIDREIETLFSANGHLFVGAATGVYIYDNSDPSNPSYVSSLLHARSCDPVVVSGQYAYVSLRSGGGFCRRGQNSMDVIDISDIQNPVLLKTYAMQNPKGLGVEDGLLFVCDGKAGLKTFNLDDPANPVFSRADTSLDCYDLIPNNSKLVVSDDSGILQFSYTAVLMSELSHIPSE